jgi:hypothetical protein
MTKHDEARRAFLVGASVGARQGDAMRHLRGVILLAIGATAGDRRAYASGSQEANHETRSDHDRAACHN